MLAKAITLDFCDFEKVELLAKEAFPPKEYLSPRELVKMSERGDVDFWGLYDEETFVGFMVVHIFETISYLFFLAIEPSCRSKGYGHKALRLLDGLYPDKQQVVDFEMVDETAPNNAQRISRRCFYLRNGYKQTGKFLSYLGVNYEIFCKDDLFDFATFQNMMSQLRIAGFHPIYFEKPLADDASTKDA